MFPSVCTKHKLEKQPWPSLSIWNSITKRPPGLNRTSTFLVPFIKVISNDIAHNSQFLSQLCHIVSTVIRRWWKCMMHILTEILMTINWISLHHWLLFFFTYHEVTRISQFTCWNCLQLNRVCKDLDLFPPLLFFNV